MKDEELKINEIEASHTGFSQGVKGCLLQEVNQEHIWWMVRSRWMHPFFSNVYGRATVTVVFIGESVMWWWSHYLFVVVETRGGNYSK